MITKTRAQKLEVFSFKNSDVHKQTLIQMAKDSKKTDPKPSHKTILGKALFRYTSKNNKSYDPEFTKKIKTIRPEWLLSAGLFKFENNVRIIVNMAKNGEKRPAQTSEIGNFLSRRTTGSYRNTEFSKMIRKLRPDWFVSLKEAANNTKKELIEIAKKDLDKPSIQTKLGRAFFNYTNDRTSSYDKPFTKLIQKLRPDWFITKKDKAEQKRADIILAAKKGLAKPKFGTLLGNALNLYTGKSNLAYNKKFDKLIRKLRPDWFEKKHGKNLLYQMAIRGDEKPRQYGSQYKLGHLLAYYTGKNTCDPKFNKLLRKTRPDWFVTVRTKKNFKKAEIIEMAKRNEEKPSRRKHPILTRMFYNITNKNSASYDKEFTNILKKLRPDWFETTEQKKKNKKIEIINMARKGIKPNTQHHLFTSFHHYIKNPEFRKKIKSIRPEWFEKATDSYKQQLIEIAKKKEKRPSSYKNSLGKRLISYTNKSSDCYDEKFTKLIQKLRPDWFEKRKSVA